MSGRNKSNGRVRQACEPCRRKKSKCSGELPRCSLCDRLRQPCAYSHEPDSSDQSSDLPASASSALGKRRRNDDTGTSGSSDPALYDRINSLEATLAEVLQALRDSSRPDSHGHHNPRSTRRAVSGPSRTSPIHSQTTPASLNVPSITSHPVSGQSLDLDISLKQIAATYRRCCECQPLPLFEDNNDDFIEGFPERGDDLICAVIAVTSRFLDDEGLKGVRICNVEDMTQKAFRLAMQRVVNSKVELSTLQTFCILVLLDLDAGRKERARMLCSLAASLACSANLHVELPGPGNVREERRRCFWAIALLGNLIGGIEIGTQASPAPAPCFPRNPSSPFGDPIAVPHRVAPAGDGSFKVMEVVLKVSDVWAKAQEYVKACGTRDPVFPWLPDSHFCKTTTAFMGLGARLPLSHRYRSMDISQMTHDMLENDRGFWGPWFLSRLMYHTIPCLLNHPLLLTLQIGGAHNVTEAFLHQTAYSITNHVSWNIHFIQLMRSRDFVPNDPVMIYCAAVVATIELQRSLSRAGGSEALTRKSQENFDECLGFIKMLQMRWAYAGRVTQVLSDLAADMSSWARSEAPEAEESIKVDLTRILDVLDFGAAAVGSVGSAGDRGSLFGTSLQIAGDSFAGNGHGHVTRLPRIDPTEKHPLASLPEVTTVPPDGLRGTFAHPGGSDLTSFTDTEGLSSGLGEVLSLSASDIFNGPFSDFSFWPVQLGVPDIPVG